MCPRKQDELSASDCFTASFMKGLNFKKRKSRNNTRDDRFYQGKHWQINGSRRQQRSFQFLKIKMT